MWNISFFGKTSEAKCYFGYLMKKNEVADHKGMKQ